MRRIDEVMRKVIGSAIATELQDPRIGFVTVTAVQTSPDLRSARVYVSVLGDEDEREATMAALKTRQRRELITSHAALIVSPRASASWRGGSPALRGTDR